MTTDRNVTATRIERLPGILLGLFRLWAGYIGGTVAFTVLFGAFAPIGFVAILLTLGLPILVLYLWGRALDEQLGWLRDDGDGPW